MVIFYSYVSLPEGTTPVLSKWSAVSWVPLLAQALCCWSRSVGSRWGAAGHCLLSPVPGVVNIPIWQRSKYHPVGVPMDLPHNCGVAMAVSPKSKMCKVITFTGQQLPVFCSVVAVPKNADPKGLSPPFVWVCLKIGLTSPCESPCSSIFSQGNPVFFRIAPPKNMVT